MQLEMDGEALPGCVDNNRDGGKGFLEAVLSVWAAKGSEAESIRHLPLDEEGCSACFDGNNGYDFLLSWCRYVSKIALEQRKKRLRMLEIVCGANRERVRSKFNLVGGPVRILKSGMRWLLRSSVEG